jgi:hypothetical protein
VEQRILRGYTCPRWLRGREPGVILLLLLNMLMSAYHLLFYTSKSPIGALGAATFWPTQLALLGIIPPTEVTGVITVCVFSFQLPENSPVMREKWGGDPHNTLYSELFIKINTTCVPAGRSNISNAHFGFFWVFATFTHNSPMTP